MLELELDLLLDRHDSRRQQPAEAERVALLLRERRTLVQETLTDQVPSPQATRRAAWGIQHAACRVNPFDPRRPTPTLALCDRAFYGCDAPDLSH
jgi:hypothetical protein